MLPDTGTDSKIYAALGKYKHRFLRDKDNWVEDGLSLGTEKKIDEDRLRMKFFKVQTTAC